MAMNIPRRIAHKEQTVQFPLSPLSSVVGDVTITLQLVTSSAVPLVVGAAVVSTAGSGLGGHITSLGVAAEVRQYMTRSGNATDLNITGPLWRESTGHRWIPFRKVQ